MKILLADDDLITSEIIKQQLEQWGYEVVCEYNGNNAWQRLQEDNAPKMAILDWQMPGITGVDLCRKLRAQKSGTYIYVVMLTSMKDKAQIVEGLEAGADDYLSKPCNPQELKVRLIAGQRILALESELLASMKQLKEMILINREQKNVYETKLTGRELDILRLMASGQDNEEITKAFHMSPAWVSAYITSIVQKLEVNTPEEAVQKALRDNLLQQSVFI